MSNTFKKGERLKSRKLIKLLFEKGKRLKSFPIHLLYLDIDHDSDYPIQVGFSAPKRYHKKAIDRNRIKRLMREAYRLHKKDLFTYQNPANNKKYILMFIYMSNDLPKYVAVESKMKNLLMTFNDLIE